MHQKFLLRNGADEIIYPEKQLASWTAIRYTSDHIFDYIELNENYSIFEISVPKGWTGKTVGKLDIRKKYNIIIMGIKVDGQLNLNITTDTVFSDNETLLVLGNNKDIQKCFHI